MLAAWRVLLAAIMLLPLYIRARRRYGDAPFFDIVKRSLIPGLILSVHFIFWVYGARLTPGANATLIVTLMPLVMPFFMLFLYQEQVSRIEVIATALAIVGILILAFNDFQISAAHLKGDVLCLLSMILFAAYLALARRNLDAVKSVWLYIVPLYATAGLFSLLAAALTGPVMPSFEPYNVLMVLLLAGLSTVIGHTALNFAMQHMRGQTVTLLNMLQFVVAGIAGFIMYTEIPSTLFYVASALIVAGILLVVFKPAALNAKT